MNTKRLVWYDTLIDIPPLNTLHIAASERRLVATGVNLEEMAFLERIRSQTACAPVYAPDRVAAYTYQMQEYLRGERTAFTLPLDLGMATTFQKQVLEEVCNVSFGKVASYRDIAVQIGKPLAARAVGQSLARNPLPVVIPCHRIIRTDGELCGYSANGGIELKRRLLQLESTLLMDK